MIETVTLLSSNIKTQSLFVNSKNIKNKREISQKISINN